MFAQYTLPHIQVPIYVAEGLFDPWQLQNLVQLSGGPAPGPAPQFPPGHECDAAQLAALEQFGEDMRGNLSAALRLGRAVVAASAFVPACIVHCQSISSRWGTWALWHGGRPTSHLRDHFHRWWVGGAAAAPAAIDERSYAQAEGTCHSGSPNELCG
eukprot:COSAG01_NODE_1096_length_11713_cov_213.007060_6_plen_157_part_00